MKQVLLRKFINKKHVNIKSDILRRFSLGVMAIVGALGFTLSPVTNVFAASPFDTSIKPISSLTIASANGSYSQNITTSYRSVMSEACGATTNWSTRYDSFVAALSHEDGRWAITQSSVSSTSNKRIVWIGWSTDPYNAVIFDNFDPDYMVRVDVDAGVQLSIDDSGVVTCSGAGIVLGGSSDFYGGLGKVFVSTYPVTYPSNYTGAYIPGAPTTASDSDGDGLSDYVESTSFPDRDNVFCNTTVNPYACAYPDPLKKDIYLEVDWMVNGTESYKPNTAQIAKVVDGLNDNGYEVHIDTGQLGGGNALSSFTDYLPMDPAATSMNFFKIKDGDSSQSLQPNFNPDRKGIWRYLISGYRYNESPTSSGASFAGSDNVFVSYGMIEDGQSSYGYSDLNTAIAGTIVHEVGHSLCLSDSKAYSYQSSACQFSNIDEDATTAYDSVMNYNLQMFQNNYSDGSNGTGDHDDWSAIDNGGIADIDRWTISEISYSLGTMHEGITLEQAKFAQKNGTLGKLKKADKLYDYRKGEVKDLKTNRVTSL